MATNEQMREQIRGAHTKIKALRQHQRSLESRLELQEKELVRMQEQIEGFSKLVRDMSASIQRGQQAQHREVLQNIEALDKRVRFLEPTDAQIEAKAEAADAAADLPASER